MQPHAIYTVPVEVQEHSIELESGCLKPATKRNQRCRPGLCALDQPGPSVTDALIAHKRMQPGDWVGLAKQAELGLTPLRTRCTGLQMGLQQGMEQHPGFMGRNPVRDIEGLTGAQARRGRPLMTCRQTTDGIAKSYFIHGCSG
ncbi:hypothetical protein MNKW57_25780 [Biformimicrobium ophioploci]|uniref:Uncharacterized protein n=1 Tax=Biformimicrobium ophioploci TaxID=3036711 RepID=A0ABQ6M1U4_9GAMM|nr:hypothetical protein MNKW57_25780 [Microbulbifer sp. NKW57]